MELYTYKIENKSHKAHAIKVLGDFAVVKPNETKTVENCYHMDSDRIEAFELLGVIVKLEAKAAEEAKAKTKPKLSLPKGKE